MICLCQPEIFDIIHTLASMMCLMFVLRWNIACSSVLVVIILFASFPQVKTPVMLNIGLKDLRVPPSQGLEYYKMLKARGVPVRWVSALGCLCQLFDCSIITWLFDCSIITRFLCLLHHHMVLCLCSIITWFLWLFHHHVVLWLFHHHMVLCSIITWFFDCSIITRFLWLFHHHKISLTVPSSQDFFDCFIITWFFDCSIITWFFDCSIITRFLWLLHHHVVLWLFHHHMVLCSIITRFLWLFHHHMVLCSIITRFLWLFHHHMVLWLFHHHMVLWLFHHHKISLTVPSSQGLFDCSIITRFLGLFHHHKISLTLFYHHIFLTLFYHHKIFLSLFYYHKIFLSLFYHHKIFFDLFFLLCSIITRFLWLLRRHKGGNVTRCREACGAPVVKWMFAVCCFVFVLDSFTPFHHNKRIKIEKRRWWGGVGAKPTGSYHG